jgi:hypothetical protein
MNRFTPSMCHEPSACGIARVRPAPTSEPASGSVSTMVEPHCFSTKSWAHFCCSGVPSFCTTDANDGPDEYIQTGAFAPSTFSARPHQKARGASVPPSSEGRSSRQNSDAIQLANDFLNDSGRFAVCVAGSKTGGLRSAST